MAEALANKKEIRKIDLNGECVCIIFPPLSCDNTTQAMLLGRKV